MGNGLWRNGTGKKWWKSARSRLRGKQRPNQRSIPFDQLPARFRRLDPDQLRAGEGIERRRDDG